MGVRSSLAHGVGPAIAGRMGVVSTLQEHLKQTSRELPRAQQPAVVRPGVTLDSWIGALPGRQFPSSLFHRTAHLVDPYDNDHGRSGLSSRRPYLPGPCVLMARPFQRGAEGGKEKVTTGWRATAAYQAIDN
jgi:hypothetical protein